MSVTLKHKNRQRTNKRRWHFGISSIPFYDPKNDEITTTTTATTYIIHGRTRTHICAESFFLSPPFLFPFRKCKTKQDRCIDITAGELAFFEECNNNRLPFARMINSSRLAKKQASLRGHKLTQGWCGATDMHRNDVHNENFKHDRNNGHTEWKRRQKQYNRTARNERGNELERCEREKRNKGR